MGGRAPCGPLAHPPSTEGPRAAGPTAPLVCAPHHRPVPGHPHHTQPLAGPAGPNRVWVGGPAYLPRQGGGWCYLAVWQDRCSTQVVGWNVRATIPKNLVSEASRPPTDGAHCVFRLRQSVYGQPIQETTHALRGPAKQEPTRQRPRQRTRRIVLEPLQNRTARRRQLSSTSRSQARNQPPHRLLQCAATPPRATVSSTTSKSICKPRPSSVQPN